MPVYTWASTGIGVATVSGHIVYDEGFAHESSIPFAITIGDTCCAVHAEAAAKAMVEAYAWTEAQDEQKPVVVRYHNEPGV